MKLDAVAANYDRLAPYYDLGANLAFHRLLGLGRLHDRTIDCLGDVAGAMALGVGCGTGNNWPRLVIAAFESIEGRHFHTHRIQKRRCRMRLHRQLLRQRCRLVRRRPALKAITDRVGLDVLDDEAQHFALPVGHGRDAPEAQNAMPVRPAVRLSVVVHGRRRREKGGVRITVGRELRRFVHVHSNRPRDLLPRETRAIAIAIAPYTGRQADRDRDLDSISPPRWMPAPRGVRSRRTPIPRHAVRRHRL